MKNIKQLLFVVSIACSCLLMYGCTENIIDEELPQHTIGTTAPEDIDSVEYSSTGKMSDYENDLSEKTYSIDETEDSLATPIGETEIVTTEMPTTEPQDNHFGDGGREDELPIG